MKIAFVNDDIYTYATNDPSAIGGAERQQWLLARALTDARWSVTVGVRGSLEAGERRTVHGVEFVGIGRGQILKEWYRFLVSERPNWLYWRCADHLLGPMFRIARLAAVRTIFSAGFDTDVRPRHALARRPHWWPLYAWGLSQAERVFIQHGGQLAQLPAKWRSKAYLVPSIVGETRAAIPHSKRSRYVAWVAVLRQHKRPELLVEIASKAPDIHFIACGGPSTFGSALGYSERIMEALKRLPNVEFLGKVAPVTAQQVIAEAAMFLSTSNGEGFPNTFLQAWASGTPVVSLDVDPGSVIERLGLGAVPNTIEGARQEIYGIMDSPTRRDVIALRAQQYVAQHHSEAVVVRNFQRAVSEVYS